MDGKRFDDISKILATNSISRRQVVRRLGGGLLGTALAGFGLSRASAANGGNSANAQWCHANFSGAVTGQCISDAARGTGLSYQCGPASDGSLKLCGDTCAECCNDGDCAGDETCVSGACQTCEEQGLKTCGSSCISTTACCGGCPTGSTCVSGACQTGEPIICTSDDTCQSHCPGSTNPYCECGTDILDDQPVCYLDTHGCAGHLCSVDGDCTGDYGDSSTCVFGYCTTPDYYCSTDADCGAGYYCVNLNGGCGGCDNYTGGTKGICQQICTS